MNKAFSFHRFRSLLGEMIFDKSIFFLGILIALVSYHFLTTAFFDVPVVETDYQFLRGFINFSGASAGFLLILSVLIKRYDGTVVGIQSYMLPASIFEKWLSIICILVAYLISHNLLFKLCDEIILVLLAQNDFQDLTKISPYSIFGNMAATNFILIMFFASLLLLGSTYFKRNKIVFTLISSVGILLSIFLLNWAVNLLTFGLPSSLDQHTPFVTSGYEFTNEQLDETYFIHVQHSSDVYTMLVKRAFPLLSIILFIIYYFRLKETEI